MSQPADGFGRDALRNHRLSEFEQKRVEKKVLGAWNARRLISAHVRKAVDPGDGWGAGRCREEEPAGRRFLLKSAKSILSRSWASLGVISQRGARWDARQTADSVACASSREPLVCGPADGHHMPRRAGHEVDGRLLIKAPWSARSRHPPAIATEDASGQAREAASRTHGKKAGVHGFPRRHIYRCRHNGPTNRGDLKWTKNIVSTWKDG